MKLWELLNSVILERKLFDYGLFYVDVVKVVFLEIRKRSVLLKDNEIDFIYKFVRIIFDELDVFSIYYELRGIRILLGEKKILKDLRILCVMGYVIEIFVMVGFGLFLCCIKEEFFEDEFYGEKLEKRIKNIFLVEFIKMELENE